MWTIIKKELKQYFSGIGSYVLIALFLVAIYYFFLQYFFVRADVSVSELFYNLSLVMPVFVAAITMGSFAGEKDKLTIEYLLTKPIKIVSVVMGKILAATIFAMIPVILTLPIVFMVGTYGSLDGGEIFAGYLAILFLTFTLVAIGVAISSFFKKQITAFLVIAVVLMLLSMSGSLVLGKDLPNWLIMVVSRLSIYDHYDTMSRGLVLLTDVAYFALLSLLGIVLSVLSLSWLRFGKKIKISVLKIGGLMIALVAVGVVWLDPFNLFASRIDLTSRQKFQIADLTKQVLRTDPGLTVDVFISADLPEQFQSTVGEIRYMLNDYGRIAGDKMTLNYLDPAQHVEELEELGIFPVQFNVMKDNAFEQRTGYIAVVFRKPVELPEEVLSMMDEQGGMGYEPGRRDEVVNFAAVGGNIDYELTKALVRVKSLDSEERQLIGSLYGDAAEIPPIQAYNALISQLGANFDIEPIMMPATPSALMTDEEKQYLEEITAFDEEIGIPDLSVYNMILVPNPSLPYRSDAVEALLDYYENGGKIVYLAEGGWLNNNGESVQKVFPEGGQLFSGLGVTVNNDLVLDFDNNEVVQMQTASGTMPVNYPYWVRAQVVPTAPADFTTYAKTVSLPWTSSLHLVGGEWQPLYVTSVNAVSRPLSDEPMTLEVDLSDVQEEIPDAVLQQYVVAALRTNENGGSLYVFGDASLFEDQMVAANQQTSNGMLGLTLFENTVDNTGLRDIQARQVNAQKIVDPEVNKTLLYVVAPILSGVGLVILIGANWWRKKRLLEKLAL